MRLWHESLIPALPRYQLLGQHRECCALRGNGWGKNHATVQYVFRYSPERLFLYHEKVMVEMRSRGYRVNPLWEDPFYRGKQCSRHNHQSFYGNTTFVKESGETIYPEHDEAYLQECIENLRDKGFPLSVEDIRCEQNDL
ncbi:TIGR02328 family protein [Lentibacillus jeotgali]|uniref:TIGR02328 family protein n=1 Tax=Lentibacillus jeotgali TaxID=558169 RepID=UPI0002628B8D|nr:TIGR02328 family protein [Lentibacillus jeotgali]